jgi:hypothetical protein
MCFQGCGQVAALRPALKAERNEILLDAHRPAKMARQKILLVLITWDNL